MPDADDDQWTVEVVELDDADSMDVRFPDGEVETIRLLGIDSPETGGYNYATEFEGIPDNRGGWDHLAKWGDRAAQWADEQLKGEEITIATDPIEERRGDYDRLLVYVYDDGTDAPSYNRRALSNGYARLYDSEFTKLDEFEGVEKTAREAGVGLWGYGDEQEQDPEPEPEPAPEPDDPDGGDGDDSDGGGDDADDGVDLSAVADVIGSIADELDQLSTILRNADD